MRAHRRDSLAELSMHKHHIDSSIPPPSTLSPSVRGLTNHLRLWRHLPGDLWPRWKEVCALAFREYTVASRSNNSPNRLASLIRIVELPQRTLIRRRGGQKSQRSKQALSTQLQRHLKVLMHQEQDDLHVPESLRRSLNPDVSRALHVSRATRALLQTGLAPMSSKTQRQLQDLHPTTSNLAPEKKHSQSVRPIAMGEAFYKLAGHYALYLVNAKFPDHLESIQLVHSPGGPEKVVHLTQSRMEMRDTGYILLKLDIENAFNKIQRSLFLSELFERKDLDSLWRLAHWAIASEEGVRQGCVMAAALSCIGIVLVT